MIYVLICRSLDNDPKWVETAVGKIKIMEKLKIFLRNLHPSKKSMFRSLEKLNYKLIDIVHTIQFNKNCIRERLCPKSICEFEKQFLSWLLWRVDVNFTELD